MIDFSKIELVIFDMDGTLIDSGVDLGVALHLALQEEGYTDHTPEGLTEKIWMGFKHILGEILEGNTEIEQRVLDRYSGHYKTKMFDNATLYSDVNQLLELLKTKQIAILSNQREQFCHAFLKHFGIDHHFKMVLGGDSLPTRKPDPAPILHICKALGVKPENTLMVGDSPIDLEAGEAAGVMTLGLLRGLTPADIMRKSKAHVFMDRVGDMISFLKPTK